MPWASFPPCPAGRASHHLRSQSGAKATRSPNASRPPSVCTIREAFGVRACSPPLSWGGKVWSTPALSPALSPEERENRSPSSCESQSPVLAQPASKQPATRNAIPSPGGEGQDEGGRHTTEISQGPPAHRDKLRAQRMNSTRFASSAWDFANSLGTGAAGASFFVCERVWRLCTLSRRDQCQQSARIRRRHGE